MSLELVSAGRDMVPVDKVFPAYCEVRGVDELPELTRERIAHFFEHYKDLEKRFSALPPKERPRF